MENRLYSLDVFRGMTIFFMIIVNTPGSWNFVYAPLLHAKWDGCTPTDLVFPFFLFIVGISMCISFQKYKETSKKVWIQKVISRGIKIILIGLLLNWFPFYTKNIHDLRLYGVLQRIGLAFLAGGLIVSFFNSKAIWLVIGALLLGYWGILTIFPGYDLSLEGNLVQMIDLMLMGESHIYKGYGIPFDPEGLLSTIPSIGTVLLGYMTGNVLNTNDAIISKIKWLGIYGVMFIILGLVWSQIGFPLNKPIWSSSYVLFTAGLAMIMMVVLIWLIDMKRWHRWSYVFNAFGKNPLVSFVLSGLLVKTSFLIKIGDENLYQWSYNHIYQVIFGNYLGSFLFALSVALIIWVIAWWMDRKGIIFKV